MRIGKLRYRVQVQQAVETADGAGGVSVSWSDYVKIWADVSADNPPNESLGAERRDIDGRWTLTVRKRSDIVAGMRISWDGRLLMILGTAPKTAGTMVLQCSVIDYTEEIEGS
jgi:SPP1 family predicted phage head-tail adaptor